MQAQSAFAHPSSRSLSLSLIQPPMRTCVYRFDGTVWVNINEACELPPFGDYTISEYLEDLATYDGMKLASARGNDYRFADGTVLRLDQRQEALDEVEYLELLNA
ncbi:MAG TPA: hypothetical protein VME68_15415 [Acidobacteriaceae bacterium]|nr:hypothetical protein [Acidobacteriaceae bacterium]